MCRSHDPAEVVVENIDDQHQPTLAEPTIPGDLPAQHPKTEPLGDPLQVLKDRGWTRFFFQNPDGVSVGIGGNIETTLQHAKDMQCDHLVLPETKLDVARKRIKSRVHEHCRNVYGAGRHRAVTAASDLEYIFNKPGGVLGVTIGRLAGRVLDTGSDSMGRWVYTKFSASGEKNITLEFTNLQISQSRKLGR